MSCPIVVAREGGILDTFEQLNSIVLPSGRVEGQDDGLLCFFLGTKKADSEVELGKI